MIMKSDEEITRDINAELQWESRLDGSEVKVDVNKGHVTLTGTTDSYPKKVNAESAVRRVTGVVSVDNELQVKISPQAKKSDPEIKRAVVNAITWNSAIDENNIEVTVQNGLVTLEGEVTWDYQRSKARLLAEDTIGVVGVVNLIKVISPLSASKEIEEKIYAALKRNFYLNPVRIKVEVMGNKAVLSGEVRTLAEKSAAENVAWSAPGITKVENKLEINYRHMLA